MEVQVFNKNILFGEQQPNTDGRAKMATFRFSRQSTYSVDSAEEFSTSPGNKTEGVGDKPKGQMSYKVKISWMKPPAQN